MIAKLKRILFIVSCTFASASSALPFTIVPASPLPQTVMNGESTRAIYTVTNNTISQRNNNTVAYLPPNVTVNNTLGCTSQFNLAPSGQPGSSCNLYLTVTGPVSATDPDPHHHLLVCFPGNMSCAGTNYPLNVTTVPLVRQVAYVSNAGGNTISVCPISQSTGLLGACTSAGGGGLITQPLDIVLNNTSTVAYIATLGGTADIVVCPVNTDGTFGTCSTAYSSADLISGLTLDAANAYLYFPELVSGTVNRCTVNPDGSLSACGPDVSLANPRGRISFNSLQNFSYTASISNSIFGCVVNPDGTFGSCTPYSDPDFNTPAGTQVLNNYLYVPNMASSAISICPINGDGSLAACASSNGNGTFGAILNTLAITINSTNYLYVPTDTSGGDYVSVCPIESNGTLGTCVPSNDPTFFIPTSIWIATFPTT